MTKEITGLTSAQLSLLKFVGSAVKVGVTNTKMEAMNWTWVPDNVFSSHNEGPCFVYVGANSTRYNIRPWKKADGRYVWRCQHPAFRTGDELMEFLDPVSCAVAQEIANGGT